ncbi:cytochrome P450 [Hazenella sp. IB182357]|uniref:Cytochrome P450 n=1 Tax=Polycladospora coralii TaxID=2771432 RepID=A0A926N725_9BACL|nr:cytochrome P450 [Polycladospora coralii]MBD1373016.1 cytochrome P450 [Polycladospora coralii]MBS7530924.1 cytochrome P450 [Polycladospora coralii]
MPKLAFDFQSPEYQKNPYAVYEKLRTSDPVHAFTFEFFDQKAPAWLITRYNDCLQLLKDARLTTDYRQVMSEAEMKKFVQIDQFESFSNSMLNHDPPDHTRLRLLVHQAFTPRMVENLRFRIEEITQNLLDRMAQQKTCELIADYAYLLPITVISEMLGIPEQDRSQFRSWSKALIDTPSDPDGLQKMNASIQAFTSYIDDLIAERRSKPTHDLISALVQAEAEGEKLSEEELYSTIFLLIIAGHETTVNLIGNGILALLQHPEQLDRLKQHPEIIQSTIEELLRYTNPVQVTEQRWVKEDMMWGEKQFKQGDLIVLAIASANYDPEIFYQPNRLDITRTPNKHLAFGYGIHTCLGAPLARLEGQIAISALLKRFPNLTFNQNAEIKWRPSMGLRGLVALPVSLFD